MSIPPDSNTLTGYSNLSKLTTGRCVCGPHGCENHPFLSPSHTRYASHGQQWGHNTKHYIRMQQRLFEMAECKRESETEGDR